MDKDYGNARAATFEDIRRQQAQGAAAVSAELGFQDNNLEPLKLVSLGGFGKTMWCGKVKTLYINGYKREEGRNGDAENSSEEVTNYYVRKLFSSDYKSPPEKCLQPLNGPGSN